MSDLPSFSAPNKDGSRTRRYVLAGIAFLFLSLVATQIFLHQTSVGSPRFVRMSLVLWAATVMVVLALLILATVLGRNLIKLYFEHKSGQVGSRFKTKMVSTFAALSLLPAVLLFLLSWGLINRSISSWFSAPTTQMLDNSKALASQYYEEAERRATLTAANIAATLRPGEGSLAEHKSKLAERLEESRRQNDLNAVRVYDGRGNLLLESGKSTAAEYHRSELKALVAGSLAGKQGFQVERVIPNDVLREAAWATSAIRDTEGNVLGVLFTESVNPSAHFKAYSVIEAYNTYEQWGKEQAMLRFDYFLILGLSTLLIVFAFSWFAMYLAKRITVPIQALAEGAAAVAAGNLDHRVICVAFDELESLVSSFNRMTSDLQQNKAGIEAAQGSLRQTNVELDDRRRYIETILQTIATGVVSLDSEYRIRTMNRAATQMFDCQGQIRDAVLEDVIKGPASATLRVLLHKSAVLGSVARNIEFALPGKTLHLATTVTPLVDSEGQRTGWVVAFDDVTELLRVEKMAAWQEVARRLAHEIKNPLTPIQLSAERVLRRYKQILPPAGAERIPLGAWRAEFASFDDLLEECVRTITQEAGSLKNLVDEFSRFARLPEIRLEDTDLHQILENTLSLYHGRVSDVTVLKSFGNGIPRMKLDSEQMKRVFINLFDNAFEAMADSSHSKVLQICTSSLTVQRSVRVEITDTGRGFPKEYQDSLFLPYFSTRKDGTGLGLAIVRQIITDHHGKVQAEPNVPVGTKITIDLPA